MTPHEWLATITDDSQNEAARRARIPLRTLYHQLSRGSLSPENVIKLAEAYDVHPLRALIDTEHVDERWAHVEDVVAALRLADPRQLADEMLRRLLEAERDQVPADPEFTTPLSGPSPVVSISERSNAGHGHVGLSEDDVQAALSEANDGRAVAQDRTEELTEPDTP